MHERNAPPSTEPDVVDRLLDARVNYCPDVSSLDDLCELLTDARAEIERLRESQEPTISPELRGTMWADLFSTELAARSAQHHVTRRALTYLEVGLPLTDVLDAVKVDRDAWAARVEALEAWQAENRAASARIETGRR